MKRNTEKNSVLVLLIVTLTSMWISAYAGAQAENRFSKLESTFDGKIGVYALDTNNNEVIAYRAEELFPVQSTFKLIGVGALLKKSLSDSALVQKRFAIRKKILFIGLLSAKNRLRMV